MPQRNQLILPPAQRPPVDGIQIPVVKDKPQHLPVTSTQKPVVRAPQRQQVTKRRLRVLILSTYGESGVAIAHRLLLGN